MKKKIFIYSYVTAMYLLIAWWICVGVIGYTFSFYGDTFPIIWHRVIIVTSLYFLILYFMYRSSEKMKKILNKLNATKKDYFVAFKDFLIAIVCFIILNLF